MAETPAAPLEKAVEESRRALVDADRQNVPIDSLWRCYRALRSLLAALDADKSACEPGVICPTCVHMEKAEAALGEIVNKVGRADHCGRFDEVGDFHECDDQKPSEDWCSLCIARRYFAERGEE